MDNLKRNWTRRVAVGLCVIASTAGIALAAQPASAATTEHMWDSLTGYNVTAGSAVNIRGRVTTNNGCLRDIAVQQHVGGVWHTFMSAKADANGYFAARLPTWHARPLAFRAVAPARCGYWPPIAGDAQTLIVTTPVTNVKITLAPTAVYQNTNVNLQGNVNQPAGCTRPVYEQVQAGDGTWSNTNTTGSPNYSSVNGNYALPTDTSTPGTYVLRAFAPAWCGLPDGYSSSVNLYVYAPSSGGGTPPPNNPPSGSGSCTTGGPTVCPGAAQFKQDLFNAINLYRQQNGLPSVVDNACLDTAAQNWANTAPISHNSASADGQACGLRGAMQNVGGGDDVQYVMYGDNGQFGWTDDANHRAVLLSTFSTAPSAGMGIGIYYDDLGYHAVLDMGY